MIWIAQWYEWHRTFVLHWYRVMTTPNSLEYIHIYTYYIYAVLLVAQSCPALCNPIHCSPAWSSLHGDSLGKNTGVGCHALQQISTQGSNPDLLHGRWILYHLSHQCMHIVYAEHIMRNAGLEVAQLGSRLPGEISITSDMQMTPPLWQKVKN